MNRPVPEVLPTSEARARLSEVLAEFRRAGSSAAPVFFGSHRKPEGVVLPFALFEEIAPFLDDIAIAAEIRDRLKADSGKRLALDQLASELGFDPKDLRS